LTIEAAQDAAEVGKNQPMTIAVQFVNLPELLVERLQD